MIPEGDRMTDVFNSKSAFPYSKQEAGTPFYNVFPMMSYGGSIITCMCK